MYIRTVPIIEKEAITGKTSYQLNTISHQYRIAAIKIVVSGLGHATQTAITERALFDMMTYSVNGATVLYNVKSRTSRALSIFDWRHPPAEYTTTTTTQETFESFEINFMDATHPYGLPSAPYINSSTLNLAINATNLGYMTTASYISVYVDYIIDAPLQADNERILCVIAAPDYSAGTTQYNEELSFLGQNDTLHSIIAYQSVIHANYYNVWKLTRGGQIVVQTYQLNPLTNWRFKAMESLGYAELVAAGEATTAYMLWEIGDWPTSGRMRVQIDRAASATLEITAVFSRPVKAIMSESIIGNGVGAGLPLVGGVQQGTVVTPRANYSPMTGTMSKKPALIQLGKRRQYGMV